MKLNYPCGHIFYIPEGMKPLDDCPKCKELEFDVFGL